ncbi:DUF3291 domain-containing protein [Oceanospirillum sediminis]|uniref:DUF3291 domain-containing protein n=1 Tax=Oceanospirillum sediminis TaxID=2760088 RepID=A0A839IZ99_9GAMM|nr:DUF3291 domain-containing protein [Oceanospirillum sediminis]MBB1489426.1 DUF3291 domain-containing protein [Oceanospirillum sediminis]
MTYQLAQINIARAVAGLESEQMAGFVARLDEINALADQAPGFVWRLQSEAGDATSFRVFDDPLILANMSVWQDIGSLKDYVYKSLHVELIRDRDAWFKKMTKAHQALWWIPKGHIPSLEEGKEKLEYLAQHGPGPSVFTFARAFPAPEK